MCKTTVPQPRIDTPATKGEQEQKVFPKVTYGAVAPGGLSLGGGPWTQAPGHVLYAAIF